MLLGPQTALAGAILVLALANLLNNWIAPNAYVFTAVAASAVLLGLLRAAREEPGPMQASAVTR